MTATPPSTVTPAARRAFAHLVRATWISLAAHFVAGLAMLLVLRHGLDSNGDLAGRLEWLDEQRLEWTLAWVTWNVAALSILTFYALFRRAHDLEDGEPHPLRLLAILAAASAVALDLGAEALEMGLIPELAAEARVPGGSPAIFLAAHRAAVLLTGFGANTLYTLAAVLLIGSTRARYGIWTMAAGVLLGVAGTWLSIAALLDSVSGMVWSNAVLVPALVLWHFGVLVRARSLAAAPAGTAGR